MSYRVLEGDCVELMAAMPAGSVDAVVCDPPYGLEFMGKDWDRLGDVERANRGTQPNRKRPPGESGESAKFQLPAPAFDLSASSQRKMQEWHQAWATEALRVLKPGGHLLAFGGTRTYHRLVCAVEDAGFEIRDTISWLYGSGFPKSLDVGKAIDRAAGAEREVVGQRDDVNARPKGTAFTVDGRYRWGDERYAWDELPPIARAYYERNREQANDVTAPATPEAERWEGWGTALKPAHEPIVVARKPLSGTVAACVLEHGTGALNVDGCRVGLDGEVAPSGSGRGFDATKGFGQGATAAGGGITEGGDKETPAAGRWPANVVLDGEAARLLDEQTGDLGASRFFYCSKAGREERSAGLNGNRRSSHPTVKPIGLMRWLVRLVTPPNGTVLDPFAGSGTTGCAAVLGGFDFVGLEREPEYVKIAEARIAWWHKHRGDGEAADILAAGELRDAVEATGQLGMFD